MLNHFKNEREVLIALREGKISSERSGGYWSDAEKDELRRYFMDGDGISQIAVALQRSENAIVQQLMSMGLLIPTGTSGTRSGRERKCRCPQCRKWDCPYYSGGVCCYAGKL